MRQRKFSHYQTAVHVGKANKANEANWYPNTMSSFLAYIFEKAQLQNIRPSARLHGSD